MADIIGPLRPSDSWSTTEVRSLNHSHVWTIKGFSQCDCRYLETSVKVKDPCAVTSNVVDSNTLTFRIRLHPQGNKESNKDFSFFQVFCNQNTTKYRAKFAVFNSKAEEIPTTVYTGTQQLHGYFEYIRRDLLVTHIQPLDELQLVLNLTVTFDTVTRCSQTARPTQQPEARPAEVTRDLEAAFKDQKYCDFKICVGDKEIQVHKVVIASRSPYFAAMLEPHTEEAQSGRVTLRDIDYEVLEEMLLYMYCGRTTRLSSLALEILGAADRFQLPGLKEMADMELRNKLMVETVCRNLVYADMYSARELKADAIRFIAQNNTSVLQTDGWQELLTHGDLLTEVFAAMSGERSAAALPLTTTHSSSEPPPSKRLRISAGVESA